MIHKDKSLAMMNSYLMKTTLLNMMEQESLRKSFESRRLGYSVSRFLYELWACMAMRKLPHHFYPMHNLLIKHNQSQIMAETEALAERLEELITIEDELMTILTM